MTPKIVLPALGLFSLAACQTAPLAPSGYLSGYDGVQPQRFSLRAAIAERRDPATDGVTRLYLQPAVLAEGAGASLDDGERNAVLREVDRRLCFDLSRRFLIAPEPSPDAGVVRTMVTEIRPTGRFGSGASVAAGYFNPVPLIDLRAPGATGGLAIESELIGPDGRQMAAITWARNATVVGREAPSLSRIGDAVQLVEPMGDAVRRAYASPGGESLPVPDPDPCAAYGPRRNIGRWVADKAFGFATGLYQPEVSGLARPAAAPEAE